MAVSSWLFCLIWIALFSPYAAFAQIEHNAVPFNTWLQSFEDEAREKGISDSILQAALRDVQLIPRVIELDRKQPEGTLTFSQYITKVVPQSRIQKARALYAENQDLLESIAEQYDVQPEFIVALWGIESDFGQVMGSFEIIPALATLAYDGRRSAYFRGELLKALRILNEGHISVHEMKGSWAGAMGQSQFMPSSFLNFAVDGNGDGKKDIWGTKADVFASIANYLHSEGWNGQLGWGGKVSVNSAVNPALADITKPRPYSQWRQQGVQASDVEDADSVSLISVNKDEGGEPYYLVTNNYRVILKWNRSRYFATAVGMLADGIVSGE